MLLTSPWEIWYDSEMFNAFRGTEWMREPCRSSALREVDFDGCQAYQLTGDAAEADPICELSPHRPPVDALARDALPTPAAEPKPTPAAEPKPTPAVTVRR